MSFSEKCSVWLGGSFSGGVESPVLLGYLTPNSETQQGDTPSGPVLYGDVDGDGEVKAKDKAVLARHLAGWPGYETLQNPAAADVDTDGKVVAKDKAILARHLAGWPGYESLPKT
jgi:hypothetical protein